MAAITFYTDPRELFEALYGASDSLSSYKLMVASVEGGAFALVPLGKSALSEQDHRVIAVAQKWMKASLLLDEMDVVNDLLCRLGRAVVDDDRIESSEMLSPATTALSPSPFRFGGSSAMKSPSLTPRPKSVTWGTEEVRMIPRILFTGRDLRFIVQALEECVETPDLKGFVREKVENVMKMRVGSDSATLALQLTTTLTKGLVKGISWRKRDEATLAIQDALLEINDQILELFEMAITNRDEAIL